MFCLSFRSDAFMWPYPKITSPLLFPPVIGSINMFASPLVVLKLISSFRAFSCSPPEASATSSPLPPAPLLFVARKRRATPRGRLVDDGQLAEATGVPEPRDRGELRVHLQPGGAAGEEQVGEAGLRGDGPIDQEGVVDQDALGAPFDREPGRGRVAAHQRRFDAEVADDLPGWR